MRDSGIFILLAILVLLPLVSKLFATVFMTIAYKFHDWKEKSGSDHRVITQ
jgi:hypothetical protein